jgi:hypothetical protein
VRTATVLDRLTMSSASWWSGVQHETAFVHPACTAERGACSNGGADWPLLQRESTTSAVCCCGCQREHAACIKL